MQTNTPFWKAAPDPSDDDDIRGMTAAERLELFFELCDLMRGVIQHREDVDDVLNRQEPLSPESEALWRRLVARGRGER